MGLNSETAALGHGTHASGPFGNLEGSEGDKGIRQSCKEDKRRLTKRFDAKIRIWTDKAGEFEPNVEIGGTPERTQQTKTPLWVARNVP